MTPHHETNERNETTPISSSTSFPSYRWTELLLDLRLARHRLADQPCHGDILIDVANRKVDESE